MVDNSGNFMMSTFLYISSSLNKNSYGISKVRMFLNMRVGDMLEEGVSDFCVCVCVCALTQDCASCAHRSLVGLCNIVQVFYMECHLRLHKSTANV